MMITPAFTETQISIALRQSRIRNFLHHRSAQNLRGLSDVSADLGHLSLCFQVSLETPIQDLALTGLQAITQGRNAPDGVS